MEATTIPYGMMTSVELPYERAVERTREALGAEGFGVLTEIDVRATLEKKLGVQTRPYTILGACNPPLAHQAFNAEPNIGLLLPCNVVVYAVDGGSVVEAMDPEPVLGLVGNPALAPIANDVKQRLEAVIRRVGDAS